MKKRGIGFACSAQGVNYHFGHEDVSNVEIQVQMDNTLLIRTAASDIGQGLEAVLINITSIALNGFPTDKILWEGSNTTSPDAGGTGASRQSTLTGNALVQTCENFKTLLRSVASEQLDCHPDSIEFQGEHVSANGKSITLSHLFEKARGMGLSLTVIGTFKAPMTTALSEDGKGFPINQFGYAAHIVELEVDTITGEVVVLKVDAFHDAGRILNPIGAAGQVEGATVMGMGFALFEDYILAEGKPVNVGFTNYLIPSLADTPDIHVHFLSYPSPIGRLGVKGLAEAPTTTIAPAIANAIFNATGARITHLPATPSRVLAGLTKQQE
ncbi:MAG: molybdopterin-dependent oxidoreductase [Anaerolineales bacterium]|uniref:Molybdopterin-dependent oxidoreductase n=1 Tax=Candidatus Desulfolinea nitratireducens TaxID=2841698 RepID=A0A8J6TK60_9CHLR|nr:molybdopterin-dependent oxidoreductase [Candidatus Desulfolinea nitratireducens]